MLDAEATDDSQEDSDPQPEAPPSTQIRKRRAHTSSDDEGNKKVKKARPKTAKEIEEELQADDMEEDVDPDLQDLALLLGSDGAPRMFFLSQPSYVFIIIIIEDVLKDVLDDGGNDGGNGEGSEQNDDDDDDELSIKKDIDDHDEVRSSIF